MKKLYMLAAGALCAAMASAANGDVTDGWLMLEDFEGNPEVPGLFSLYSNPAGEVAIETIATDENADNKAAHFTGGDYNSGLEVKVNLPSGKTLADYDALDFDIYDFGMSYKSIFVRLGDNIVKEPNGNDVSNKKDTWSHFKYDISATQEGSEVLVRVGFKISSSDGSVGFGIDNIRLREKVTVTPGTYDESKNGTVTDGWLMIEDFQKKPLGDEVTVQSYYGGGGKGSAKVEVDPVNGKNLAGVFSVEEGDYNTVFALNVTLPEGKTLKDYEKIAFDLYRFSDDENNKQMYVKAGNEQIYLDSDDSYPEQAPAEKWTAKEYTIESTTEVGNIFTLLFGIKTNKGHYAVDNVRLLERAASVVELDGEPSISISHDTAAGEMTVSYSFNVTGYAGEEIKVVANVDGHEEVIFEEYVPEAGNAPMRAAAENRTFSGSLKATHEVLKALANPDVKVSATADDKELFAVTKAPDSTTGITGITADSETEAEYFNLQGIRIANPEPGQLYIRRQGSKAVKIRF